MMFEGMMSLRGAYKVEKEAIFTNKMYYKFFI